VQLGLGYLFDDAVELRHGSVKHKAAQKDREILRIRRSPIRLRRVRRMR
jgi:hypothetical protein